MMGESIEGAVAVAPPSVAGPHGTICRGGTAMDEPTEDEGQFAYTPPPGPSVRDIRRRAAERGDVTFFLDLIRTQPWSMFSIGEVLKLVMRAAEVRARSDPAGYSRELFSVMVGFN